MEEPQVDISLSRFVPKELLKSAHGVKTFLGKDVEEGRDVVIKTVARGAFASGAHFRLEHEAAILRQLRSQSIASPLHIEDTSEYVTLVYPYVSGITLRERLARGRLSAREAIDLARRLLTVLAETHEHGVMHADITPSNIVLTEELPNCRVTLIDFGFARSRRFGGIGKRQRAGTVSYISPEAAGLIKTGVDERSDLYSLGVVIYECLAGECPFQGRDLGEILRRHLTYSPPPLRRRGVEVPQALDEVIERLMRKDPRDRYQTAQAALADLTAIQEALDRGMDDPAVTIGSRDQRRVLTEPAFIGRRAELRHFHQLWEATSRGEGGLVFLEAESGGGKTRFLEEISRQLKVEDSALYWGQGLDQAGQRPFQALVGIAEQIASCDGVALSDLDNLRARLGDQLEAVCTALPELSAVLTPARGVQLGPEDFGEFRNLQALSTLLGAIGTAHLPALVFLDDCQWADELTLKLVQYWNRQLQKNTRTRCHTLVVVAFRSEEVRAGSPLRRTTPKAQIVLPPFGESEIRELVSSMAGALPETAIRMVSQMAEGSPFMVSAILRGLVESGALIPEHDGWRMGIVRSMNLNSSRAAATFLMQRLELLPESGLRLLTIGAVLGKEFRLELAAKLAGEEVSTAWSAAEEARRRHILWILGDGDRYTFVHDKLREACLGRLDAAERGRLHLEAAKLLLERQPDAIFELAYHFDAGGDSRSALPYALAAAKKARTQHSLEIALQQFKIAERGTSEGDRDTRKCVLTGLGETSLLRGEYDAAEAYFVRRAKLVDSDCEHAEVAGKLGEIAFKRGDMLAASVAIERALRTLGQRVPRTWLQSVAMVSREIFVQALHTWFPRIFVGRHVRDAGSEREFIIMRLCSRLAYVYWFQRGKAFCLWTHLREMNLAEKYPPSAELGQAYSEHSPVMTMIPWCSRGIEYAERGLAIRRTLGDLWGEGQSLHFYGISLYAASRFEDCLARCREGVRVMERAGDQWEVNTANWHIAFCLYRLGEMREAVEMSRHVYQSGLEIDDRMAQGIALSSWSRASGGKVPEAIVREQLARQTGDAHTRVEVLLAEAVRLLSVDQASKAVAILREAREMIRIADLHQDYVATAYPWLVTALRRVAEGAKRQTTPRRFRATLREIRKPLREALRISSQYRNNYPHAQREAALVAALRGKERAARRAFDRSLREAEAQGAKVEVVETLRSRGLVGQELGWDGAASDLARSAALESELHFDEPPRSASTGPTTSEFSLADRFDLLLEAGRRIGAATTVDAIYAMVREISLDLLRGETSSIFVLEDQTVRRFDPSDTLPYSGKILAQAMSSHAPVIWLDGGNEEVTESILISGSRSVLCAPISVRGKVEACFYVTHRTIGALFAEEERRLAAFISTLAGISLENAAVQHQLVDKAEELARSNTDLQRFAYVASHDLKEPLRMVSSFLRLLERSIDRKIEAKERDYLRFAVDGARRMYGLIDGLLEYSRVGAGEIIREPVDLSKVLATALVNLKPALDDAGAVVEETVLPTVLGHEIQLLQLLQNLVGNAVKFRRDEPPRVKVSATREGGNWHFTVTDNGIGIDTQYAERIFIIFQRLHTREQYSGTGIGLAVCKRIVERHGGKIWVGSTEGIGSTFHFTLPSTRG